MNTKKALGLIVLVVIIGLLIWKFSGTANAPVEPVSDSTQVPTSSINGAVLGANGDFNYKNETDYIILEATYPSKTMLDVVANAKARVVIESWVQERLIAFQTMVNDEMLTPDEMTRLKQDGRKYALDISYKTYSSPGFVSYVFPIYEDTGGAHPNGYSATLTFNANGEKVELEDLFVSGSRYLDRLSTLAYNAVVAQAKTRFGANTELDDGQLDWIRLGTAPTPETLQFFYLDQGTLVLIFPPYQVAAYAAGSFEARIPLANLQDILKK